MEPLEVTCPCGKTYQVPMKYWGKRGKCPNCGNVMTVPFPGNFSGTVDSDMKNRAAGFGQSGPSAQARPTENRNRTSIPSVAPARMREDYGFSPDRSEYGGFWRRFLALNIDTLIWLIGSALMFFVVRLATRSMMDPSYTLRIGDQAVALQFVLLPILFFILHWVYYTVMESSSAMATLGKRCLGLIVTDMEGRGISFLRANGRYWSKVFISDLIPFLIGYMMAGWTKKKQAVHDLVAGTLVLKG